MVDREVRPWRDPIASLFKAIDSSSYRACAFVERVVEVTIGDLVT